MPPQHLDPDEWHILGRGRLWPFKASTEVLRETFHAVAEATDRRLELLMPVQIRSGRCFESTFEVVAWDDLGRSDQWQYFVRDAEATPAFSPSVHPAPYWTSAFAVNGLLLLQHPDPGTPVRDRDTAVLGVVHRVGTDAGEELHHEAYDKLFASLKRALQRGSRVTAA